MYAKRGEDKKALEVMQRLEQRFPSDAGVLSAIAEFYGRVGKEDLAIAEYERLAKLEPDDASHLVILGEQVLDQGRQAARGSDVEADHEERQGRIVREARRGDGRAQRRAGGDHAFTQAIKLDPEVCADFYKGRSGAYEMARRWDLAKADLDKLLASSARSRPIASCAETRTVATSAS